jgi:hypothetical protein
MTDSAPVSEHEPPPGSHRRMAGLGASSVVVASKPNIVFFLADDLGSATGRTAARSTRRRTSTGSPVKAPVHRCTLRARFARTRASILRASGHNGPGSLTTSARRSRRSGTATRCSARRLTRTVSRSTPHAREGPPARLPHLFAGNGTSARKASGPRIRASISIRAAAGRADLTAQANTSRPMATPASRTAPRANTSPTDSRPRRSDSSRPTGTSPSSHTCHSIRSTRR